MVTVDICPQITSLLGDSETLGLLPHEILVIIRNHVSTNILDAISQTALTPHLTQRLFVHFENVFPDICARWTLNSRTNGGRGAVVAAFARVLPFAPYLSGFLERYLENCTPRPAEEPIFSPSQLHLWSSAPQDHASLQRILLTAWRLNSFDQRTYGNFTSPSDVQALFQHEDRAVRYLAIRIFCQLLQASDFKLEALINEHVGTEEPILGDFDGREADYGFLSLAEHGRIDLSRKIRTRTPLTNGNKNLAAPPQVLTPLVASYGQTMLPRPCGPVEKESSLVFTLTVRKNLEGLAKLLQRPGSILLHGLPGSGKTSLIHEVAKDLGMNSDMVTLHLNEQTDAKMLIGLYSTGSKPGTFEWRPGVLTKAVKEGRWVLIEDLDRAPTEVISSLLPLVERGELLIPSRSERIHAASGFRLFATVRTVKGMNGQETIPHLLGLRFWQLLGVQTPPESELREILHGAFPILDKSIPQILAVYYRLCRAFSMPSMATSSKVIIRQMTLRDLLKWCRRLKHLLASAGSAATISENTRERMFMEAVDCFLGHLPEGISREYVIFEIGEEMHMSKSWIEHHLSGYVPSLKDSDTLFRVGRSSVAKRKARVPRSRRPFADTAQAKRLLEQLARSVQLREPVLLVGETGIGKTAVVQQLADVVGRKLVAVNLSQQSEVGDLIGGFKPVNSLSLAMPLKDEFDDLFRATGLASKNQEYMDTVGKCVAKRQWTKAYKLWARGHQLFNDMLEKEEKKSQENGEPPAKRQKKDLSRRGRHLVDLQPRWDEFGKTLDEFSKQISSSSGVFVFSFVEGNIVKAARNGDWVLLDEINLASSDTLESIVDLLTDGDEVPSILLSETGGIERIKAHPDFRIFGAMNPATDVGKRDLPVGIRSRFTEIFVNSPDRDHKGLLKIVKAYLQIKSGKDEQAADDIAKLYLNTKRLADEKSLVDGANEVPHFSLRTLTRVLTYAKEVSPYYGLRRALYEGFSMGFLTLLNRESEEMLVPLICHHLFGSENTRQSLLSQPPKLPDDGRSYVRFKSRTQDRQYWLLQGDEMPVVREDYIIAPSVERNLLNLVRATSNASANGGYPVLIQGPTSSGKTSMIEYLANFSGNRFVRINNHEHTDLQEYLGTYVSGPDGKLRFQDGLLVQAMRKGHWIVLDELNLAPTDVLEALNRLLDDNRELLIPETQEVVRPHENFRLFATQNPPGIYGGRKILSRAFRNRFLELHFDDIPENELEFILQRRSKFTAPSDCQRIVSVYKELSTLRQTSRIFEQKDSFATLRDLFRWALRDADNRDQIAANGFMLLAERVRNGDERTAVKEIIERVFKVKLDLDALYAKSSPELRHLNDNGQGVVWTQGMRRLYMLVSQAVQNREPVLLVGETGCGKTTVCQVLAEALGKELHIVNAHQNTETGDVIGSQRPIRNRAAILESLENALQSALDTVGQDSSGSLEELLERFHQLPEESLNVLPQELRESISATETRSKALFEWSDGSLVQAMKTGQFFLLDEISLADDSVLERLNSVLEPHRTLLLAEKGIDNSFVTAEEGFQFLATMNPGGDFGKKELSPALRNRFTEIWVPPLAGSQDIPEIVMHKLSGDLKRFASVIVEFSSWFGQTFRSASSTAFSIREVLVWVQFVNSCQAGDTLFAMVNGAATVFIDSLGANPSGLIALDTQAVAEQRSRCLGKLGELLGTDITSIYSPSPQLVHNDTSLSIGQFSIPRISARAGEDFGFFSPPTTRLNTFRVVRALQMRKPILLEGNPGVGKTTLVAALAQVCGQPLTRINLSDQTDLMDLFGTDVPVDGAEAGNFAWRDAPFLRAMQRGEWVLLDEMNLASQSVLEGLNACLDHRGEVYISELDQVFKRHPDFRLFAAQNPHHQGGGRKGLPSSFVNRFVVVYADVFSDEDLRLIASHKSPNTAQETIGKMIEFITTLDRKIATERSFGSQGGPWEFNLRDLLRWLQLLDSDDPLLGTADVDDLLDIIIRQRFRTPRDRQEVAKLFSDVFNRPPKSHNLYHDVNSTFSQIGLALMRRNLMSQPVKLHNIDVKPLLSEIESLIICVTQNMPVILSGPPGSGKSVLVQHMAALAGKPLVTFPLNADIDTMDLVGGFEQSDPLREINSVLRQLQDTLQVSILSVAPQGAPQEALQLLHLLKTTSDTSRNAAILGLVERLLSQVSTSSEVGLILARTVEVLKKPTTLANPRFEWLDGVIIKALESGQWLVLDNANLCSASVLDRLNSLLEPGGFISVNEHCDTNGEPRLVKPHPEFRIFLTMDPRYGELSRAMRNRAIEIHLDEVMAEQNPPLRWMTDVEGALQRFGFLASISKTAGIDSQRDLVFLAAGNLTETDVRLLPRFAKAVDGGFLGGYEKENQQLKRFLDFVQTGSVIELRGSVSRLYSSLPASPSANLGKVQPIFPTRNLPIVPVVAEASGMLPFWLAACYEFLQELQALERNVQRQAATARNSKLASLNRLQRSSVADRVTAVAKDSTSGVSKFLNESIAFVYGIVRVASLDSNGSPAAWEARSHPLRRVLHHLWRTLHFVTQSETSFDEAVFQAHLTQGKSVLNSIQADDPQTRDPEIQKLASRFQLLFARYFDSGFGLKTGLSMEEMWRAFRPEPIANSAILQRSIEVAALAQRFDNLRWKVRSPISDLGKAVSTLSTAFGIIRNSKEDTSGLVKDLASEIDTLEARIGLESVDTLPYFAAGFETLRQASLLRGLSSGTQVPSGQDTMVLSNTPTMAQLQLQDVRGSAQQLQLVDYLTCQDSETFAWSGKVVAHLLNRVDGVGSTTLNSLALLEMELPQLGRTLSHDSQTVTVHPLTGLDTLLRQLLIELLSAHEPGLGEQVSNFYKTLPHTIDASSIVFEDRKTWCPEDLIHQLPDVISRSRHLLRAVEQHLHSSWCALAASNLSTGNERRFMAAAWIQFAIGALGLYVPNRILDPHLRLRVEAESHKQLQDKLNDKLATLVEFELRFTGQTSSLHSELVGEEIRSLGTPPEAGVTVYRPERSELGQIHAEFNNVLKATVCSDVSSAKLHELSEEELGVISANVIRVMERLSGRFEAYQDMIRPVINLLRCLKLGLSLISPPSTISSSSINLLDVTPFLGGKILMEHKESLPTKTFEFIDHMALTSAIEGIDTLGYQDRQAIFACFHGYYNEWSQKLEADRKEEEAKHSLYRFKGSYEDEEEIDEEEFNELFPVYDAEEEESTKPSVNKYRVRDMSVKVAEVHRLLLLGDADAPAAMRRVLLSVGRKAASELAAQKAVDHGLSIRMLPSVLVALNDKITALNDKAKPASYNFYADANPNEARQLVQTVNSLKTRFRELQLVDEIRHLQPLVDVQTACDRVLELFYTEPLAKILPKVEHVHATVYEWQFGGWASRVYSVPELYNRLTETIVRWRRLELSTWSKLFEMEVTRCQDDANAWWFVAYQATIANSMALLEKDGLQGYAASLIGDLETYFSSAILGQFSTRLNLLRQFHRHLELLVKDYPALSVICNAVGSFISVYQRYQKPVDEAIARGRSPIEKKMKDVLLLASWKDTNINALRESARKSHQKLFRIVRKFRDVLGQPMKQIIEQGLPDEDQNVFLATTQLPTADINQSAVELADDKMLRWLQQRGQLTNVGQNVAKMSKLGQVPQSVGDQVGEVESFMSGLNTSIQELRKETPSILTDENKVQVKHLKTRKRKLFADVLRQARQMGFEYNLDTARLAQQDSVQVVLAKTAPLVAWSKSEAAGAEYFYYKFVDLMPKVRRAANEHSEDLTGREVARSIGFLEGMLNVVIGQRECLSGAKALPEIEKMVTQLGNIRGSTRSSATIKSGTLTSNVPRVLKWVVEVLRFSIQLVDIHTKLGGRDNSACRDKLQTWLTRLREESQTEQARQGRLPEGLTDSADHGSEITRQLKDLELDVRVMAADYPSLEFILLELLNWTAVSVEETGSHDKCNILGFAAQLSQVSELMLRSVEEFRRIADEEASSYVLQNNCLSEMMQSLEIDTMATHISQCIRLLGGVNLHDELTNRSIVALLGMFIPIADQYAKICRHASSHLLDLHRSTVQFAHCLGKVFVNLASQGFCTPQEKSDETSGAEGKMESGTGLGEGEGAEDISKDIQPDEDLTELAQESNKEKDGDIEDEKDAVDMADEELEGEMGSVAADDEDEKSKDGEESEDDMDEEAGDVDDLDATAKDEKMREGDGDEAEKDQQGEKPKGQRKEDELMAAEAEQMSDQEGADGEEPEPEETEEAGAEAEKIKREEEMERQDQNVEENEALALPEDMELDFDEEDGKSEDDELDDLSDIEKEDEKEDEEFEMKPDQDETEEPKPADEEPAEPEGADAEAEAEAEAEGEDADFANEDAHDPGNPELEPQEDEKEEEKANERLQEQSNDAVTADAQEVAPSDVRSGGQDQTMDSMDLDDEFRNNSAQQEQGAAGDGSDDQQVEAGGKGTLSREEEAAQQKQDQDAAEVERSEPFRKLGDTLQKWHRQRTEINEAEPTEEKEQAQQQDQGDMEQSEFQHLQDENAVADAQAMGAATEEEARPVDDAMAIDDEKEDPSSKAMPAADEASQKDADEMETDEPAEEAAEKTDADADNSRTGVKTKEGTLNRDQSPPLSTVSEAAESEEEDIEETSAQLSTTHLTEKSLQPLNESVQRWLECQAKTQALSQSLTSQLRLILTPSQSTKLSGAFRTGKRLNIKRIIPYIASGYKRDKIWMRRSVPTKRAYQILMCVDDSSSMCGGDAEMAVESLVMVARALSMLEVGQVGVLGFGADVFVAHDLTTPLTHTAGGQILQHFTFQQNHTNISLLVRQTIQHFRTARLQNPPSTDLWQLSIILSDGLAQSSSHDEIRRLLREALEERIMFVFVVMDDAKKRTGESVLNLREAKFIKDEHGGSRLVIERYLESFPFGVFLVVHEVAELPGALAGVLRGWFAEVSG